MPNTTDRFASGSQHLVETKPFDVLRWLFALSPRPPMERAQADEAGPEAVFVVAADGIVTRANAGACTLTGRPMSEILGTYIGVHVSGGEPRSARARRRDGRDVEVELWLAGSSDGGVVATVRPIAGGAPSAQEDDFAGLAHDLKGPLSTIAIEAATLQFALAGVGGKAVDDALARIARNVDFMDRLIADLLDVTLLEAGHFAIHTRTVELVGFLASVIERSVPTRERARILLAQHPPIAIPFDELRIARVVANLMGNAIKYAPRGSPIRIEVQRGDGIARVSVVDVGPGLTDTEARYVFDRYRRTRTAAARHDGSGLGLFVSRKIVEAHGGRIGVSPAGTGSRFFFELPLV